MAFARTALLTGVLLAASVGVAGAQNTLALVTSNLHFRAGPGTENPSLGLIPGGTKIQILKCGDGWCHAEWLGRTGYVNESYLDFGGPPQPPRVLAAPAPVYSAPPRPRSVYESPVEIRSRASGPQVRHDYRWRWRWRW